LAAVFCIENVPTIGFLVLGDCEEQPARIDEVHHALWNQGLMTLLLVLSGDVLRAYSLGRRPQVPEAVQGSDRRLVETFDRVAHALELRHLVLGIESGRWWCDHEDAFDPSERVDQVLLGNLMTTFHRLCVELPTEAAQALLLQTMFIAYLEDRGAVLPAYFEEATGGRANSLLQVLSLRDPQLYDTLFDRLRRDFNGDIFLAPCAFELHHDPPLLGPQHFIELEAFRSGREIMETGQGRFWAYDFGYIPVVLLSAVYDRFLSETPETKRKEGAYYTPMFLADIVVSQTWEALNERQRSAALIIDPACGSGIFLVRLFQRIVEHARAQSCGKHIGWGKLLAIAKRLHGTDVNPSALRVALFSLYIALLEQVTPPDIRALMQQGRMLPEFWGHTLRPGSFFEGTPASAYDIVIGNPPWTSRREDTTGAQKWCEDNGFPCPLGEAAWGFIWMTSRTLAPEGIAALLLPAMGVLHNHAKDSIEARRMLLRENRIERVINFSDLTFQLFEGADRPAALVLYR
jgi:hypothetical protein